MALQLDTYGASVDMQWRRFAAGTDKSPAAPDATAGKLLQLRTCGRCGEQE